MERLKPFLPILVSIIAAIFSILLIYRHINRIKASIFEGMELQRVLSFKYDVEPGTAIEPDMFEIKEIPQRFLDSTVMPESQITDLKGRRIAIPAKRGDILRSIHIQTDQSDNLSTILPNDFRAVTIGIDDINSISYSIKPGDRVDIFATFSDPVSGQMKTRLLFQNIEVLSTGTARKNETKKEESLEEDHNYTNITLLMKAKDAALLVFFRDNAKLSIILRNPYDKKELKGINDITSGSIYFGNNKMKNSVEVIFGARITE